MALQHKIDKETFSTLHADVQKEYSEQGGEYYLQVEGMVPNARVDELKTKVDEFRSTNVSLLKLKDELTEKVEAFGEWTPETIKDLKVKAEAGGVDESKLKGLVDAELQKRIGKMTEEHKTEIKKLSEERDKANLQLRGLAVDNELKSISVESGVRSTAIQDILLRGRNIFHFEEGKVVAKDEKGDILYGKDGQTSQTMGEWLGELKQNAPHLFEESKGTGSKQQQRGGGAANNDDDSLRGRSKMNAARESS